MEKISRFKKFYRLHREKRKQDSINYNRNNNYRSQKKYQKTSKGKEYMKSEKNKEYMKNYSREYQRKMRSAVIVALGSICTQCSFNDIRALQIDHINGGGSLERKGRKYDGQFHKHVLQSFLNKENKYQLLCANCNWIKRSINNENKGN